MPCGVWGGGEGWRSGWGRGGRRVGVCRASDAQRGRRAPYTKSTSTGTYERTHATWEEGRERRRAQAHLVVTIRWFSKLHGPLTGQHVAEIGSPPSTRGAVVPWAAPTQLSMIGAARHAGLTHPRRVAHAIGLRAAVFAVGAQDALRRDTQPQRSAIRHAVGGTRCGKTCTQPSQRSEQ